MPGDLKDPDSNSLAGGGYYDPRYEPGTNTFESRPLCLDDIIQGISKKNNGYPLGKEELSKVYDFVKSENLSHRNPGDQEVQDKITNYIKDRKAARKVAQKWLT
jgi:hypothetical protein